VSIHDTEHKNFLGTWVGSREDKPDEVYEIEITDIPDIVLTSGVPSRYELVFKNISNEGDGSCTFEQGSGSVGYNTFSIRDFIMSNYFDCLHDNVTSPISVIGIIEKTGNLRIEWTQSYGPDYDESLKIVFNGRKK